MKYFILLIVSGFVGFYFYNSSTIEKNNPKDFPKPTDPTVIHSEGEDGDSRLKREKWFDIMHGGDNAPWKSIEAQNRWERYISRQNEDHIQMRNGDEWVADQKLLGRWIERGSNNNAGNIMAMDFDAEDEILYVVGGGGPIFKGDLSGAGWQVVNDQLRFSTQLIKVIKMPNAGKRIVSAISGVPHYSDDDGKTWIASTGVTANTDGDHLYDSESGKDSRIFILTKRDYWTNISAYVSEDFGATYSRVKTFNSSDSRNINVAHDPISNAYYVIQQTGENTSDLFKYNPATKTLDAVRIGQNIAFGANGNGNLQIAMLNDTLRFYVYDGDNKFYTSKDEGLTWEYKSVLPSTPWDIGVFVLPSNPRVCFFGEVDCFRSQTGGQHWSRINNWWEYYGETYSKLHADIMRIKEFTFIDGRHFLVNANHGGLYFSDDEGLTYSNLGIYGLNVSQYYDVRTYPFNKKFIFAGSQDQGQQRGEIIEDFTSDLYQNISGDYGHIIFTNNGKSLWSVYPGGSIGFYSNPLSQNGPIAGYEIKSQNETVWIPPIIPSANTAENVVYAAGGSINESSNGSFIIRLEFNGNDIVATQLPFDFSVSGGQISAMAIDPQDSNIWYVITTNGNYYKSIDAGQSFVKKQGFLSESHYLYGSCILPSTFSPNTVYISGNGYSNKPVYKSTNNGDSFGNFSNGLPSTMVFNIVANEDESLLFAATENGPYVYIKQYARWFDLSGEQTPNQTYWSVEYIPETKTARFATYGRGVWDFDVKQILSSTDESISSVKSNIIVYPNPSSDYIQIAGINEFTVATVTIFDSNGKIRSNQSVIYNQKLNIQSLNTGVYHVLVTQGNKKMSTKLVVER